MNLPESQQEFEFDATLAWEQQVREPSTWHDRFRKFVDLGPGRKLSTVYRDSLGIERDRPAQLPGLWKRMARRWKWVERAQAFDRWTQQQHALEVEQVRRARLEQLLALDRDVHYPRIVALNKKIDEAVASGLGKTVKTEGGVTMSLDRADGFQKMCDELARLEEEYFAAARALFNEPSQGRKQDDDDQPVTVIGRFEYIPDPEVPDPPPTSLPHSSAGGKE